ncbi:hypothetical protein NK718_01325 [Alsobacter sp. SYSU M60028]|uniref:Guanylate cyclase domain-containing protein n=1 Tax=Alsobacter ponti TaxID=2962936 RepID=A0ABT1L6X8_9HYPH|nr:adenylate/guanylate cyclase domain-containing protein [Alsobacter ponti]MCP8937147.1 hypothetical protein [Alsobacter ponti]
MATVERRLVAIFCADVAGYSRLMHGDEAATLRLLTSYRDMTDRLIAQFGGRIANTAGDSILAEFATATAALQCGLTMQDRIAALNDEVAEARRLSFRIGLHVGEVNVKGGDLFGDGVNIAARMQTLAPPGAICLSEISRQFVRPDEPIALEDLGPQAVKNIDTPVRAFVARPANGPRGGDIPLLHRRVEFHLARRYHQICEAALSAITGTEDLAGIEYASMASLHDAPGLTRDKLAERVGLPASDAAPILDVLARRGFVEVALRHDDPAQCTFQLTPAGHDVRVRLRPAIAAAAEQIVAPLSDEERAALRDLLARIIQAHEAKQKSVERGPDAPPGTQAVT